MTMAMDADRKRRMRKTVIAALSGAVIGFVATLGLLELIETGVLGELDASREIAALVGLLYLAIALAVAAGLVSPRLGARFLNLEDADELREQKSMLSYSALGTAALGVVLLLLALAAPAGPVPQVPALAGSVALFALAWWMGARQRRHTDELMNAVSNEASTLAFYFSTMLAGGWAMLAHLGYATGPQPLDLLTIFAAMLLLAAFVVTARRGMLVMR